MLPVLFLVGRQAEKGNDELVLIELETIALPLP